jgi:hypothetical protein
VNAFAATEFRAPTGEEVIDERYRNHGQPRHDRDAQFDAGAANPPAQMFAGIVIACRTAWSMATAPLFEMRASDVLITEQEVAFSAGAAVAPRRRRTGHRLLAGLSRVLAGWPNASHRRPYSPPYYLERARMSREIDRL